MPSAHTRVSSWPVGRSPRPASGAVERAGAAVGTCRGAHLCEGGGRCVGMGWPAGGCALVLTVGCHLLAGHLGALSGRPLRRPRGRRPPPGWASAWPLVARTNRRPAHNSAPDLTTGSAAGDVTAGTLPQRLIAARSSRATSLDAQTN